MSADRSVIKYLLKTELNMKDEQRHALLESQISLFFFWSHGGYGDWVWSTFSHNSVMAFSVRSVI